MLYQARRSLSLLSQLMNDHPRSFIIAQHSFCPANQLDRPKYKQNSLSLPQATTIAYSVHLFFNPYFLTAAGKTCKQVSLLFFPLDAEAELLLALLCITGRLPGESIKGFGKLFAAKVAENKGVEARLIPLTSSAVSGEAAVTCIRRLALLADLGVFSGEATSETSMSGEDISFLCCIREGFLSGSVSWIVGRGG